MKNVSGYKCMRCDHDVGVIKREYGVETRLKDQDVGHGGIVCPFCGSRTLKKKRGDDVKVIDVK